MSRKIVAVLSVLFLLAPAALQAFALTTLNLLVAIIVVSTFIVLALYAPKLKWLSAIIAALLIAIAPYPNWVWANNEQGWHFRLGYKIQHFSEYALGFGVFFIIALSLFLILFWALRRKDKPAI